MDDFVTETASKLREEMFKEFLDAAREERLTGNLMVSKVRDYNRKWNKLAETHIELKPDGFKVFMKKELSEQAFFQDNFGSALKYL